MKDEDIIEHLLNNQYKRAVKGLYPSYSGICKLVLANSGSREDAEDLFQEALMLLYKQVRSGDLRLISSLKTYLTGIARNLWYQELRRRKKEIVTADFADMTEIPEQENEPVLRQAELAFGMLGEKCRELLTLFYVRKQSMQVIATTLGFSNERVAKNQKYRCLEKAKDYFITLQEGGI